MVRVGVKIDGHWRSGDRSNLKRGQLLCWSQPLSQGLERFEAALKIASQRLTEVFQQVPAVGYLLDLRRATGRRLLVHPRAITGYQFDLWVAFQPCGQGHRISVWQQVDDLLPL